MSQLKDDIKDLVKTADETTELEHLESIYTNGLQAILDSHAPLQEKTVTIRQSWARDEILEDKKERRRLEEKWQRTKLEVDKEIFKK